MLKSAGGVTPSGGTPVWLSILLAAVTLAGVLTSALFLRKTGRDAVVGSLTTSDFEAYRGIGTPAVFEQGRADGTHTPHTDTQDESGGA